MPSPQWRPSHNGVLGNKKMDEYRPFLHTSAHQNRLLAAFVLILQVHFRHA